MSWREQYEAYERARQVREMWDSAYFTFKTASNSLKNYAFHVSGAFDELSKSLNSAADSVTPKPEKTTDSPVVKNAYWAKQQPQFAKRGRRR